MVRSREKLSYLETQRRIDSGSGDETVMLLREVGELRSAIEAARGGVSLNLPSQEVELDNDSYVLRYDDSLPVENWNAQISLLTGMAAAEYSHVTAPIRRLVDRYGNEIAVALCAGQRPPGWVLDALPELPHAMEVARRRESELDRAIVDYVEAMMLRNRVGEVFSAWVTARRRDDQSRIQIADPAVASLVGVALVPGERVDVRLTLADPSTRRLRFEPAHPNTQSDGP